MKRKLTRSVMFIAVVVMALMMIAGLGANAGWDTGVFEDIVGTTGSVDVQYVKPDYSPQEVVVSNPLVKASHIRNEKEFKLQIENMYPGSSVRMLTQQENKGTLPVKLDKVTIDLDGTDAILKDDISMTFDCWLFDKNGHKVGGTVSKTCDLKDYEATLNNLLKGTILQPGESINIGIADSVDKLMTIKLKSTSCNDSQGKKFKSAGYFDWKLYDGDLSIQNPNFH